MAVIVFSVSQLCAANNHARVTATLDGSAGHVFDVTVDELSAAWTLENGREAVIAVMRLAAKGKTKTQIRNAVENGLTVTI